MSNKLNSEINGGNLCLKYKGLHFRQKHRDSGIFLMIFSTYNKNFYYFDPKNLNGPSFWKITKLPAFFGLTKFEIFFRNIFSLQ